MQRRTFLLTAALSSMQVTTGLGCGGSSGDVSAPASTPAPTAPEPWKPSPLYFLADSMGSVDLSQALPIGVVRGGVFALAPGSDPLPPRLSLAPDGILTASGPGVGSTANIVFTYVEPA